MSAAAAQNIEVSADEHYRTILYTSGSGKLTGYQRSYSMEDESGKVLITSEAFGHYFGESVKINGDLGQGEFDLVLKPNKKFLNKGFVLENCQNGEILADCNLRKKRGLAITDRQAGVELSTIVANVKNTKLDNFVGALDEGGSSEQSEYYVCHESEQLLYAEYSSRVIPESRAQEKGKLATLKNFFTMRSTACIFIDFVQQQQNGVDDLQLFILAMLHHEFRYARSR